jgi:dTDP-4-dehydrorhamnose reductase
LTHDELDIADASAVRDAIEAIRPNVVVNCAAMTNVDACESEPERAWAVNAEGPGHIAQAAGAAGAEVVHISTDYVFDGARGGYAESDETNPLQVYGRAKLAGEDLVRTSNARHYVIRSAWIFGPGGRNFISQMPGLVDDGGPVRAVADQRSSPTYAPDLALAIGGLFAAERYGTYHVVNEGSCSYAEFAGHIASIAGSGAEVEAIRGADVPRPAPRPHDSSLVGAAWAESGFAQLRPWRDAAAEFYRDVHRGRTA